jgi:hypothetical protein
MSRLITGFLPISNTHNTSINRSMTTLSLPQCISFTTMITTIIIITTIIPNEIIYEKIKIFK